MKLSNRSDEHCREFAESSNAKQQVVLANYLLLALKIRKRTFHTCLAQSSFERELLEGDSVLSSTLNSGEQPGIKVAGTQSRKKLQALFGGHFPERERIEHHSAANRHHR